MNVSNEMLDKLIVSAEKYLPKDVSHISGSYYEVVLNCLRELRALRERHKEAVGLLRDVTAAFEALGYRGVPGRVKDAIAFLEHDHDAK